MKKLFLFLLCISSFVAYAGDFNIEITSDNEKLLKLLKENNEIVVNTPKGQTAGVLVQKIDDIAIIAYSKDFSRGLTSADLSVTTKTIEKVSTAKTSVEYSSSTDKYGFLIVMDSKDIFGKEISGLKSNVKVATIKGNDVSPLKLEVPKNKKFLILGKVKVGGFLGEAGPMGIPNKEKYTIEKNCNLGSLIAYKGEKMITCSKSYNGSQRLGMLEISDNLTEVELLLNDKKTSDNSGHYTILYNP